MNPHSDGKAGVLIAFRPYYVKIETVLALLVADLIASITYAFLLSCQSGKYY